MISICGSYFDVDPWPEAAAQRALAIESAPFFDKLVRTRETTDTAAGGYGWIGVEEEGEGDGCERVKAGILG